VKLAEPELSELDQSWTDEPERLMPRRAATRPPLPGLPPAPVIMQMPLPRPALPTPPTILPESTLTVPTRPVPRKRDHNDSTLIVRPRPGAPTQITRRPWLVATVAGALVVIGTITIALWPTARVESAPAPPATATAVAPPAAAPVARSAAHPGVHPAAKPAKRVATAPKKKPATKKPAKAAPKKTGAKPTTAPAKPTTAPAKPTTAAAKPTAKV
jgi:hypothetical protein